MFRSWMMGMISGIMLPVGVLADADGPDFFRIEGIGRDEVVCLRKEHNLTSSAIAAIPYGTRCLENLGSFPEGDWIPPGTRVWQKVNYAGRKGWIPSGTFVEDHDCVTGEKSKKR